MSSGSNDVSRGQKSKKYDLREYQPFSMKLTQLRGRYARLCFFRCMSGRQSHLTHLLETVHNYYGTYYFQITHHSSTSFWSVIKTISWILKHIAPRPWIMESRHSKSSLSIVASSSSTAPISCCRKDWAHFRIAHSVFEQNLLPKRHRCCEPDAAGPSDRVWRRCGVAIDPCMNWDSYMDCCIVLF